MDPQVLVLSILLVLLPLALLVRRRPAFPRLPGPTLLDYLPGRMLHRLSDARAFTRKIETLHGLHGRVFTTRLGLQRVVVTACPRDIIQVLVTTTVFQRAPAVATAFETAFPGALFTMPKAQHDAVRRLLATNFNHELLRHFHSGIAGAVGELCDVLREAAAAPGAAPRPGFVDVSEAISATTFRIISNVAFATGIGAEERRTLAGVIDTFFEELMAEFVGYPFRGYFAAFGSRRRLEECRAKSDAICRRFIEKRLEETKEQKEGRQPDILDSFLMMEDVSMPTLLSFTVAFAIAATHSTSQAIAWSLYDTCCNPRVVEEIEKELRATVGDRPWSEPLSFEEAMGMPYINKVWKETLRLHPVLAGLARVTTKDVTLQGSGVHLPKGTQVMASFSTAHKDAEIWSEADMFKPERWGFGEEKGEADRTPQGSYLPFSVGATNCAGRFLADYEGPLVLAELHRRFRFSLACRSDEVVSCALFVESPRYASKKGGEPDTGLPLKVELRA